MSDQTDKDRPDVEEEEDSAKVLGDNAGVYLPSEEEGGGGKKAGADAAGFRSEINIDFGGFIIGLYQSAMVSLGEMEHPETNAHHVDLESAKHTIDILRLLQEKTEGNLDEEESKLFQSLLHKLRVAYVEAKS